MLVIEQTAETAMSTTTTTTTTTTTRLLNCSSAAVTPDTVTSSVGVVVSRSTTPTLHRIKMPSAQEQENEPQLDDKHSYHQINNNNNNNNNNQHPCHRQQQHQQVKRKIGTGKLRLDNSIVKSAKITEYFNVRRSVRKCKRAVLEEKQRDLENKVRCGIEDGLQVRNFRGKGKGVVTMRNFTKGEFVVEYIGDLIDLNEAKKREDKYAKDRNTGCYMYYFQHRNQQYCVDATADSKKLGRLVNHSRNGNLVTRIVEIGNTPHLVLIAKEDIPAGSEVTYDYGDRSRESIQNYPWLAY